MNDQVARDASKFNWVTERSSCSLPKVFKDLMLQVEEDVKTRNSVRPQNSPYEFSMEEKGSDFVVELQAKELRTSVVFSLSDDAILVKDDKGKQMFEVTISFTDDDGKCKLYVDQQERETWQVRRMALEKLMFHGY